MVSLHYVHYGVGNCENKMCVKSARVLLLVLGLAARELPHRAGGLGDLALKAP